MRSRIGILWLILIGGCEGGTGEPNGIIIPLDNTGAQAVADKPFAFRAGVPAFGTTAETSVLFTPPDRAVVTSAAGAATATLRLAPECIFTVTGCTGACPGDLQAGSEVTIESCWLHLSEFSNRADLWLATARSDETFVGDIEIECHPNFLHCTATIDGIVVHPPRR